MCKTSRIFPLLAGCAAAGFCAAQSQSDQNLTLQDAIAKALQKSVFIQQQKLTADRAVSTLELAKAAPSPQLVALGHVTGGSNSAAAGLSDVAFQRNRVGLQAMMTVYDGGKKRSDIKVAKSMVDATTAELKVQQLMVTEDASNMFFAALKAKNHMDVSHAFVDEANGHLNDASIRLTLGDATKGEVLAATSMLAKAHTDLIIDQGSYSTAQIKLAQLIGMNSLSTLPVPVSPELVTYTKADLPVLLGKAYESNARLVQLQAELEGAKHHMASSRASYGGEVDAIAGAGYVEYQDPFVTNHSFHQSYFFAGFQGSFPLFNGRPLHEALRGERDIIALKELDIQKTREELQTQVQVAVNDYQSASDQLKDSKDTLASAQEAYRLAKERYQVGRGTQQDVFAAISALKEAGDAVADAEVLLDQAALRIQRLTTGDEQPSASQK